MTSVIKHINQQIGYERNVSLKNSNMDINGHLGHVRRRYYKRPNCQKAFKNYFCWINFPRCIVGEDLTLPTCRSACENFFKSCNYQRGLWRCGKSKYFNGYEPEQPTEGTDGNMTYLREYFPGQPFRQNKYTTMGIEVPICTPALLGAASRSSLFNKSSMIRHWVFVSISILVALSAILW